MVEELGINLLIPLGVFLWLVIGAYAVSNAAFTDVLARREQDRKQQ